MELYFLVLAGCVVFLLFQLNTVYNTPTFAWKIFFKTNLVPTVINLIVGWLLVYIREDVAQYFKVTAISSIMLGFSGQVVFKNIAKMFDAKTNTAIGVNEKPQP